MSSDVAISVSGVSKSFPLVRGPSRLYARMLKRRLDIEVLRNVSFSVKRGESVGLVGINGSGKSTILQIIAGTMSPTSGRVEINGKIGAILELGAGFNPEFTGRENTILGLQLMGATYIEALAAVDEVFSFSDLGEHFDYPVKTYSSGMYVRLAFSVAVAGEPDILIVDEALAVGDAAFQRKCYEKLSSVKARGGTLLFVSHDEEAVRTLTDRAVLLHKGDVVAVGSSDEIAFMHRKVALQGGGIDRNAYADKKTFGNGSVKELKIELRNYEGAEATSFCSGEDIKLRISFIPSQPLNKLNVSFRVRSATGFKIYSGGTLNVDLASGLQGDAFWVREFKESERVEVDFEFEGRLGPGKYEIQAIISREETPDFRSQAILAWRDDAAIIEIHQSTSKFGGHFDLRPTMKYIGR